MGFFELTETDLQDGKAKWNADDTATLIISAVVKKTINAKDNILVECVVADGANAGLKHTEFFGLTSDGGKKALGIFLTSFMTPAQAASMQDPSVLINKKFTCKFGEYKGYINMKNVKVVSDVPASIQQPVAQAQPVVQQPVADHVVSQEAMTLNKNIFN